MDAELTPLVWFVAGVIFFLAELAIPGFIIFFFGIGAWATGIAALLGLENLTIQLLIFISVSLISLIIFRKKGKNIFRGKVNDSTGVDDELQTEFIGKKVKVINEIVPGGVQGKVEFRGTLWNAESDEKIEKGKIVEIISRKNLTLIVKPAQNQND